MATPTADVAPAASLRLVRAASMLAYGAALAWWLRVVGLPRQALPAFGWIWLATVAWNVRAPVRAHLAFLRDWWPPMAVLTGYLYSRGLADDLGFTSVHVTAPITADRRLFGGTLPTELLQSRLCGRPCERSSAPHWYDVALTTVYYSHFVVALTIAAVLWLRDRAAWVGFMRRYLSLTMVALVVYVTYPMAPPWLAAQQGYDTGPIARLTGRGWHSLGAGTFHQRFTAVGNPVAAMPSLHAGVALLVAVYGISRLRHGSRWLLLLYPLAMSVMLVYYAEHYVVDILAGWAAAVLVLTGCTAWERRRSSPRRREGQALREGGAARRRRRRDRPLGVQVGTGGERQPPPGRVPTQRAGDRHDDVVARRAPSADADLGNF